MPPTSTDYSVIIKQVIIEIIEEDLLPKASNQFINSEFDRQKKAMGERLLSAPQDMRNAIKKRTAENSPTAYIKNKRKITQKIKELFSPRTLNDILGMFFERHPWLAKELNIEDKYGCEELLAETLAAQFLKNLISHRIEESELNLTLTEKEKELNSWSKQKTSYFEITVACKQKNLDIEKIKDEIQAYPLKEINHFEKSNTKITNLRNAVYNAAMGCGASGERYSFHSIAATAQQHELQLSRIDIYRYLNKNYPQKVAAKKLENNIFGSQIAPFHYTELEKLSEHELNYLDVVFINTKTEAEPLWICLYKQKNNWVAYCPKDIDYTMPGIVNKIFLAPKQQKISLNNIHDSGLKDVGNKLQWHAVLLARVLPWTQNNNNKSLDQYRKNVPASLLLQDMLWGCTSDSSSSEKIMTMGINGRDVSTRHYVQQHMLKRAPFSSKSLIDRIYNKGHGVFFNASFNSEMVKVLEGIKPSQVLQQFDDDVLIISGDSKNFTIDLTKNKEKIDSPVIVMALYLLCHTCSKKLTINADSELNIFDQHKELVDSLVDYNVTLRNFHSSKSVQPSDSLQVKLLACCARNKFLESYGLIKADMDIRDREKLWQTTGSEIYKFLSDNQHQLNLDSINDIIKDMSDENTKSMSWRFWKIAEIGERGIEVLFKHVQDRVKRVDRTEKLAAELPLIMCIPNASHCPADYYIEKITHNFNQLTSTVNQDTPMPLLTRFELIFSESPDLSTVEELAKLINSFNKYKKDNPQDTSPCEITLYGVDINNYKNCDQFLQCLAEKLGEDNIIQVRLPEWDRLATIDSNDCKLKSSYRQLQNKIAHNQRAYNAKALLVNRELLEQCADNELKPQLAIKEQLTLSAQKFEGEDVLYPLTAQTPGLQQQLEQQQQQQLSQQQKQEQQQEQKQEIEKELKQDMNSFAGDESQLITRDNIDEKLSSKWQQIDSKVRELSGYTDNLKGLFSLWVGSDRDAPQVIKKITPEAVDKIMAYANHFRFGVQRDNLPAGFQLQCSQNDENSLILCFDLKEEQFFLRQQKKPQKANNPFAVLLHQPKPAAVFSGDLRQFKIFSSEDPLQQKILWHFLAQENDDEQRIQNAQQAQPFKTSELELAEASVAMDAYTCYDKVLDKVGDLNSCLETIKKVLAEKYSEHTSIINKLFDSDNTFKFSAANLKAFGQLFNHSAIGEDKDGIESWLLLAEQLDKAFGDDGLKIWKERLLNPSVNWSEILEKSELDAVALSIATLKDNSEYQKLWISLLDNHGKACGHMRYSQVWYAYQQLLTLVIKYELTINQNKILSYISGTSNFNACVFLDRLYHVLASSIKQNHRQQIQQAILDNVDTIDWTHSGFYYANRYEHYRFWYKDLELQQFKGSNKNALSYVINYDDLSSENSDNGSSIMLQALRYLSRRSQISITEFENFSALIESSLVNSESLTPRKQFLILRLIIASIVRGQENIEQLTEQRLQPIIEQLGECDESTLEWANQAIKLESIVKQTIFNSDLSQLSQILSQLNKLDKKNSIFDDIKSKDTTLALNFLNDCGRALTAYNSSYYQSAFNNRDSNEQFALLLNSNTNSAHDMLCVYPWLYSSKDESIALFTDNSCLQQQRLKVQLASIDHKRTGYLPTANDITAAVQAINDAKNDADKKEARNDFIKQMLEKGAAVTKQDAPFRPLNAKEKQNAEKYLQNTLKDHFKEQNLSLAKQLLEYIAVPSVEENNQGIELLLSLFCGIDNKIVLNDLGALLGTLIHYAHENAEQSYLSLPQLKSLLTLLFDEDVIEREHYPLDMVAALLESEIDDAQQASGLLNKNLHALEDSTKTFKKLSMLKLYTKSESSNFYRQKQRELVRLSIQHQCSEYFIHKSFALFNVLEKLSGTSIDGFQNMQAALLQLPAKLIKFNDDSFANKYLDQIVGQLSLIFEAGNKNKDSKGSEESLDFDLDFLQLLKECQLLLASDELPHNIKKLFFVDSENESDELNLIALFFMRDFSDEELEQFQALKEIAEKNDFVNNDSLNQLRAVFKEQPCPSLKQLNNIIRSYITQKQEINSDIANSLAGFAKQHFDCVLQAQDANGHDKRNYSISQQDNKQLVRILSGIKQKGRGVIADKIQKQILNLLYAGNAYAQHKQLHQLSTEELLKELHYQRRQIHNQSDLYSKTYLLACMRELMVRKTGKWPNHTQMLDLIYAALYNDESLLHQVKTGQGKSIISLMRAAFLALTGHVVDVFSAKESLSKRDHAEFSHVLTAMGINNTYLTAKSSVEDYKTSSNENIGAVNYATLGSFSLFQSTHIWANKKYIDLNPDKRVAFIDECDDLLNDHTQFNYAAHNDNETVYNHDAWVYRIAYQFYLEKKDSFKTENNIKFISRNKDLAELSKRILKLAKQGSMNSNFVTKVLSPAASGNEDAMAHRDSQLKQLLTAAHTATTLKQDKDFSIRGQLQNVGGSAQLQTRVAKVVIKNQIKEDATYSDLVQQFLHVRLNHEAALKGEPTNFFIEPVSYIALSQNAKYLLNKYYKKIEGCTGTAGNVAEELVEYKENYNIDHVVKLPTHEPVSSKFHGVQYADDETDQVKRIVEQLAKNVAIPTLVTCQDDIAVKELTELVKLYISSNNIKNIDVSKIIIDTNDSGITEKQVTAAAGQAGVITFSSRLGRGNDIRPPKDGLFVLRTYPAEPSIVKQEQGRQGRNGDPGQCLDIINYGPIKASYGNYGNELTDGKYKVEEQHLEAKLHKHQQRRSKKWQWMAEATNKDELKQRYLKTRVVVALRVKDKKRSEIFLRQKEQLVAKFSGCVMDELHGATVNSEASNDLKHNWLKLRSKIEQCWQSRLKGETVETQQTYQLFEEKVLKLWNAFAKDNNLTQIATQQPGLSEEKAGIAKTPSVTNNNTASIVQFYQRWTAGANKYYYQLEKTPKIDVLKEIYGEKVAGLQQLFETLQKASLNNNLIEDKQQQLYELLCSLAEPALYLVSAKTLSQAINHIVASDNWSSQLETVKSFFSTAAFANTDFSTLTAADIQKFNRLLLLTQKVSVNISVGDAKQLTANLCKVIYQYFWGDFDENLSDNILDILNCSQETTELFAQKACAATLRHCIETMRDNINTNHYSEAKEQLMKYFKKNAKEINKKELGILTPLFKICLDGNNEHARTKKYLSKPMLLENFTVQHNIALWTMLSQRRPLTQQACEELFKEIDSLDQPKSEQAKNTFLLNVQRFIEKIPPYVSVSYITKHFISHIESHNVNNKQTESAERAVKLCNKVLYKLGVITDETTFSYPQDAEKRQSLQTIMGIFDKNTPERNKKFFDACKDVTNNVPVNIIINLYQIWEENRVSTDTVKETIAVHNKMANHGEVSLVVTVNNEKSEVGEDNTPSSLQCIDLKDLYFKKLVSNISEQKFKELNAKYDVFCNKKSNAPVGDSGPDAEAWNVFVTWWHSGFENLSGYATIIPSDFPAILERFITMRSYFNNNKKDDAFNETDRMTEDQKLIIDDMSKFTRNCQFAEVAGRDKYKDFSSQAKQSLWQAWCAETIKTEQDLEKEFSSLLRVKQKADKFSTGSGKYGKYFASYDRNQEQRQEIMQYVTHGLIKLNDATQEKLYDSYNQLAKDVTKLPTFAGVTGKKHAKDTLKTHYKKVALFAKELHGVAQHPYAKSNETELSGGVSSSSSSTNTATGSFSSGNTEPKFLNQQTYSKNQTYFSNKIFDYTSSGFLFFGYVNSTRKGQANTLLTELKQIATTGANNSTIQSASESSPLLSSNPQFDENMTVSGYYQLVLNKLCDTQQAILTDDRGTTYNGKGYSRLSDLISEMFITISEQMLRNDDMKDQPQAKAFLHTLFEKQRAFHLENLVKRLGDNHAFSQAVKKIVGSTENSALNYTQLCQQDGQHFGDLQAAVDNINIKDVPKHLRNLVDHLRFLMPEQVQAARSLSMG